MDHVVVDMETAGKALRNNRIAEICIVRINEEKVFDKFVSLVNPRFAFPIL